MLLCNLEITDAHELFLAAKIDYDILLGAIASRQ